MNYGFTPDSQQADTTNTNVPVTAAGESQTSNNQVGKYMCTSMILWKVTLYKLLLLLLLLLLLIMRS